MNTVSDWKFSRNHDQTQTHVFKLLGPTGSDPGVGTHLSEIRGQWPSNVVN